MERKKALSVSRIFYIAIIMLPLIAFEFCAIALNDNQRMSQEYIQNTNMNWILVYYDNELDQLYSHSDSIEILKATYAHIKCDSYYEINDQPLEIADFQGAACSLYSFISDKGASSVYSEDRNGTVETISFVKAMQVSQNVQNRFHLHIDYGRLLSLDDYSYPNEDGIPILLGATYNDIYNCGDVIRGWYIFRPITFKVVGFLHSGVTIDCAGIDTCLDDYIVMPSFNCKNTPTNIEENKFLIRHYSNKLGGKYEYTSRQSAYDFLSLCASLKDEYNETLDLNIVANPIEYNIFASLQSNPYAYLDKYSIIFILIASCISFLIPICYLAFSRKTIWSSNRLKEFGLFVLSMAIAFLIVFLLGIVRIIRFSIALPVVAGMACLLMIPLLLLPYTNR